MSNSHSNDKMADMKIQFPPDIQKPRSVMSFGAEQFDAGDSFTVLVLLVLVIGALFLRLDKVNRFTEKEITETVTAKVTVQPVIVEGHQTTQLMEQLKTAGLWDLADHGEVPMMIVDSYPMDFNILENIELRKRVFLHTLLHAP